MKTPHDLLFQPSSVTHSRPYPGLRPFEMNEWSIFFGREDAIDSVLDLLALHPIVLIHGSSGSGKSSLARAGILPRLARQYRRRNLDWVAATMRPSGGPLWNLAAALLAASGKSTDVEQIDLFRRRLDAPEVKLESEIATLGGAHKRHFCILIDQFEELFRFARETSHEESQAFVDIITGCLEQSAESAIRIVLTMRSEFLGECARFSGLAGAFNRAQYLLPAMNLDELSRAIRRPAETHGGGVSVALIDRLISETRGEGDELPLIQHGLSRLWQFARLSGRVQQALDLEDLGSWTLSALLSDHADLVLSTVATREEDGKVTEELFKALTDITAEGYGTRRPQRFGDLVAITGATADQLQRILKGFRADGVSFITPYGTHPVDLETPVDVSHEALLRCWEKIAAKPDGWLLSEFRDGLIWRALRTQAEAYLADSRNILSEATTESRIAWIKSRNEFWALRYGGEWHAVAELLQASRLVADRQRAAREEAIRHQERAIAAEERAEIAEKLVNEARLRAEAEAEQVQRELEAAAAYKVAARAEQSLAARSRVQTQAAVVAAVVLMITTMFAVWQRYEADRQRASAEIQLEAAQRAQSLRLAALSVEQTRSGDPQLATLLALSALPSALSTPLDNSDRPIVREAIVALRSSLSTPRTELVLRGFGGAVTSVAFSPDGTRVVTGSEDGAAFVWRLDSVGSEPLVLRGSDDPITSVAFSPDGTRIVTGSEDGAARMWRLDDAGSEQQVIRRKEDPVRSVAFSPDGTRIAVGSNGGVEVWSLQKRDRPTFLETGRFDVTSVAFSPDGDTIVVGSQEKTQVLRLSDMEAVSSRDYPGAVTSVATSPDGLRFATGNEDQIKLWHYVVAEPIAVIEQADLVTSVAFSPDGSRIVAGSADHTARIWRVNNDSEPVIFRGHTASVTSVVFSPDGTRIVTGSEDGTARVWRVDVVTAASVLRGHTEAVTSIAFSPDGTRVVTGSADSTARIWRADGSGVPMVLRGPESRVVAVAFSPDGTRVVTGAADGTTEVWQADDGRKLRALSVGQETITSVAFSPDNAWIVTGSEEGSLRVWPADGGGESRALDGHASRINSIAFSADGQQMVTCSEENAVVRTTRTWQRVADWPMLETSRVFGLNAERGKQQLRYVVFGRGASDLVLALSDGSIVLSDRTSPSIVPLQINGAAARSLATSKYNNFLISGLDDHSVRIWSLASYEEILSMPSTALANTAVALSPDAGLFATASVDGTAQIWPVFLDADKLIAEARRRLGGRTLTVEEKQRFNIFEWAKM